MNTKIRKYTGPVYITNLGGCKPAAALSKKQAHGKWQALHYETGKGEIKKGVMVGAASYIAPPDIRIPLGVTGWHAIHIGYWNPHYDYDAGTCIRVKLDNDPAFFRISEPPADIERKGTFLTETLFKEADLTGRSLVFSKYNGPFGKKAYIAYVKLVPLARETVEVLKQERISGKKRLLQGTQDGSFFGAHEYTAREHILDLIERYRCSDVGKVLWAFNYGEHTNYPSKKGIFIGDGLAVPIPSIPGNDSYIAGCKVGGESLGKLARRNIIPQRVVIGPLHEMGIKFDATFRLAILGGITPMRRLKKKSFLESHPECRQEMRDGTPIEKASYAFPKVRAYMLAIIEEVLNSFEVDGINLCFIRGPRFMAWEKPVRDDFKKECGEDARKFDFDDPRLGPCLQKVRCKYLTQFVREVRAALDRFNRKAGKKLTLSAMTYPTIKQNLPCGFDVETWIASKMINGIVLAVNTERMDPKYLALAKASGCEVVGFCNPWSYGSKFKAGWQGEVLAGFRAGADAFGIWDLADGGSPSFWNMFRRAGHSEELENLVVRQPISPRIQLKTVAGHDVLNLGQSIYSGG